MFKLLTTISALLSISISVFCQTQNDTIFNYISKTPVIIDGQANEECWTNAQWHNIDQVWIPYAEVMQPGDFEGKFKVSWDEQYLYILVEVVDDSLSDDHVNPLQNWWDDDCLELFIDENRSKGNHELNNNAFAYHVSLFYDAIDLSSTGAGINYKENIDVKMDTIDEHKYLWEFAVKNYDSSFNPNNPEASFVSLSPNKLMGFAIAYCDNDETTARENFIGSMKMAAATANDMYKNANYFGPMLLVDPDFVGISNQQMNLNAINIYPNPFNNELNIEVPETVNSKHFASLSNLAGQILMKESFTETLHKMEIDGFEAGLYILNVRTGNDSYSQLITKQ